METRKKIAEGIAREFIYLYFDKCDAKAIKDLLAENVTWSGFPGDSKLYTGQQLWERLEDFMDEKREEHIQLEEEQYELTTYKESEFSFAVEYRGTCNGEIFHRKINLRMKDIMGSLQISNVQIMPVLDPRDDMYFEKLLKESAQLSFISNIIQSGMMVCEDQDKGRILEVDANLCRMLGYSMDEFFMVTGGLVSELIYPADYARAHNEIRQQFMTSNEYSCKHRIRKKDGSVIWVLHAGICTMDKDGNTVIRCLIADINDLESLRMERDATFENVPGGVVYFQVNEVDFEVVSANDNFFRMLGTSREEYIGMGVRYTDSDDLPKLRRHLVEQAMKKDTVDIEFRVNVPLEKTARWYRLIGRYYRDNSGDVEYICIMVDITERRQAIFALAQEKERYRIAMRCTSDIVFEYVVDKKILYVYPKESIDEWNVNIPMGAYADWSDILFRQGLVHVDDRVKVLDVMDIDSYYSTEIRVQSIHNGDARIEYQWYSMSATAVYENSHLARVIGILQNIETQQKLRSDNEELKQIFDVQLIQNYDKIAKIDTITGKYHLYTIDYKNSYDNPKDGNHTDQVEYMASHYLHRDDVEDYLEFFRIERIVGILNSGKREINKFFRVLNSEKQYRWKSYRLSYLGGDPGTILLCVQDVHDLREEQEYQEDADRKILMDALNEARRASLSRQNLFKMLTKEVRIPLQKINDLCNAMENEDEKDEETLEEIKKISKYISGIVYDITEVEQLEKGQIRFDNDSIHLHDLVMSIYEEQREMAEKNIVRVEIVFNMDSKNIYAGDEFRVRQVLANALANAIRFSPERENVKILVEEHKQTHMPVVQIEDNGARINQEYFERSYEKDEDREGFRSGKHAGTGFSLMLSKKIVELMGGKIEIIERNNGTNCMLITLPMKRVDCAESQDEKAYTDEREVMKPSVDLSEYNILLVENNEDGRSNTAPLLRINGAKVDLAIHGKEAMNHFTNYPEGYFSAIMIDSELGDMSAVRLAENIRELSRDDADSIPIIAMADTSLVEDIKAGFRNGINTNISKPVDLQRLLQILRAYYGGII